MSKITQFTRHLAVVAIATLAAQCAWAGTSISINFGNQGSASETDGIIKSGNWNNFTAGTQSEAQALVDNEGTTDATVTWESSGVWHDTSVSENILKGYLDENGHKVAVNVSGIPFASYSVLVYEVTDTSGSVLKPLTINGTQYTANGRGIAIAGDTTWGLAKTKTSILGANVMLIQNVTGETLTIEGVAKSGDNRSCIAAVQIVDSSVVIPMDVPRANYSHDFDGAVTTPSAMLGGVVIPNRGDSFGSFTHVISATQPDGVGAVPSSASGKNGIYGSTELIDDEQNWSIAVRAKAANVNNGIFWSIGKNAYAVGQTGLALVYKSAVAATDTEEAIPAKVALVRWQKGGDGNTELCSIAVEDAKEAMHLYTVTYDKTSETYTIYVDATATVTKTGAVTFTTDAYQIGAAHGGATQVGLNVGNGFILDDIGFWKGECLTSADVTKLVGRYGAVVATGAQTLTWNQTAADLNANTTYAVGEITGVKYLAGDTIRFTADAVAYIARSFHNALNITVADGKTLTLGHDGYNSENDCNIGDNSVITLGEGSKCLFRYWNSGAQGYAEIGTITINGENGTWGIDEHATKLVLRGAINGTAKASGNFTIELASGASFSSINYADDWTGTFDLSATSIALGNDAWYDSVGHAGSTIKFNSFEGYLPAANSVVAATLEFNSLTINNGYNGNTGTYNKIKGSGAFANTATLRNSGLYTIKVSDISEFTGTFEIGSDGALELPNGEKTVTGATAKVVGETTTIYYPSNADALAGKNPGDDVSNVTILSGDLPESWSAYMVDENGKIVEIVPEPEEVVIVPGEESAYETKDAAEAAAATATVAVSEELEEALTDVDDYKAMFTAKVTAKGEGWVVTMELKDEVVAAVQTVLDAPASSAQILNPTMTEDGPVITITAKPGLWYGIKAGATLDSLKGDGVIESWTMATGTTVEIDVPEIEDADSVFYTLECTAVEPEGDEE